MTLKEKEAQKCYKELKKQNYSQQKFRLKINRGKRTKVIFK